MALDRNGIARRIAQELRDGYYVNLGIGIPTLVANHIPEGIEVEFQSENGILGMGGAMDLVASAKNIIVAMAHTDKEGNSKLLPSCSLPITGVACVKKVVTDLAVLDITPDGFLLLERAPGVSVEQVVAATAGRLIVPDHVPGKPRAAFSQNLLIRMPLHFFRLRFLSLRQIFQIFPQMIVENSQHFCFIMQQHIRALAVHFKTQEETGRKPQAKQTVSFFRLHFFHNRAGNFRKQRRRIRPASFRFFRETENGNAGSQVGLHEKTIIVFFQEVEQKFIFLLAEALQKPGSAQFLSE